MNRGIDVANMPAINNINPTSFIPLINVGPAEIPITAINMFNPRLFKIHNDGSGIRPNVGRFERNQPNTNPAINAPPLVLKLMGTPPRCNVNAPTMI